MMVIRIEVSQGAIAAAGLANSRTYLLPADRCAYNTVSDNGNGYRLEHVAYQSGTGGVTDLDVGPGAGTNIAELGYIGKSGRFVATTNPSR